MSSLCFVVYQNPCGLSEPDTVLGELTEATDKQIRKAWNAAGEGSFRININSEQYTAWCRQLNYVRVYRDTPAGQLLFGFFIETGSIELVSTDEGGGEIATLAGRGTLSVLWRARLQSVSYLPNGDDLGALPEDDPDGMWHWTDRPPGAILVRQLEEALYRAAIDPGGISPFDPVTWDFTRHQDSNGDTWETSAGDLFKLAVGMQLFDDVLPALQLVGLIVYMSPDFQLQGWDTEQGADLTGSVSFEKGVDIRESATLQLEAITAFSTVEVQGDVNVSNQFQYVQRDDADAGVNIEADYGRIEGFVEYHYTPTTAKLNRAGDTSLKRASHQTLGPTTIGVVEIDNVALLDYDVGDTVATDLGDRKIGAIGLFETDGGEYDVIIEFESGAPLAQVMSYLMAG